jgi:hypothetical protein
MDERYPIGETGSVSVSVVRHVAGDGYGRWSVAVGLRSGDATIRVPGHYPAVLAAGLRSADARFAAGARLGRDEYLDLTAVVRDEGESLALSSSARSPVRVTIEVPREELAPLADLLDDAQRLIEELRQGLGIVPDALPDGLR